MAAVQAVENHADEWGLIWYLPWRICASIPTRIHSQNSLAAAAEALSLKISSCEISLKWSQRPSQSAQDYSWNGVFHFEFDGMLMEVETWSEFSSGKNTSVRRKKKPKRAGWWESQSGIWLGRLTIWVRSFEIQTL